MTPRTAQDPTRRGWWVIVADGTRCCRPAALLPCDPGMQRQEIRPGTVSMVFQARTALWNGCKM